MMDKNLFQIAIDTDETDKFFRGEGRYFVRDPDWGEHVYAAHYSGWVSKFINESQQHSDQFKDVFIRFVSGLQTNEKDMDDFFGNLSAIAYQQSKGSLSFYITSDSQVKIVIEKYLEKIKQSDLYKEKINIIRRYVSKIDEWGTKLPVSFN